MGHSEDRELAKRLDGPTGKPAPKRTGPTNGHSHVSALHSDWIIERIAIGDNKPDYNVPGGRERK